MNRRSRGISTSSKITKASCSSKRVDSGRSNTWAPGAAATYTLERAARHTWQSIVSG
jgi:hypothetical protein